MWLFAHQRNRCGTWRLFVEKWSIWPEVAAAVAAHPYCLPVGNRSLAVFAEESASKKEKMAS
jgi:hypothetical protein